MNKILEAIGAISQAPTESLIVITVLASMGFSYMIIKLVLNVVSGNKEK